MPYYFNDWRGKSSDKLVVLAIAQSFDSDNVSYYEGKNFIISYMGSEHVPGNILEKKYKEDGDSPSRSFANQIFGKKKIEELKLVNDWDNFTGTQQEYTITGKVEEQLSDEQKEEVFATLAEHYRASFLSVDSQGNSIYLLINTDTRKFFLVFIDANGILPETGVTQLWDIWDYAEELQRFKLDNGWNPMDVSGERDSD